MHARLPPREYKTEKTLPQEYKEVRLPPREYKTEKTLPQEYKEVGILSISLPLLLSPILYLPPQVYKEKPTESFIPFQD